VILPSFLTVRCPCVIASPTVSEMTCNVSSVTLNLTHSLTHSTHRQGHVDLFLSSSRLCKIGKVLDRDSRSRLVCAFILARIDYCNAVFAGLPVSMHTCTITTCSSRCCAFCRRPSTTRPRHGDTYVVTLAASATTHLPLHTNCAA